jgi:hypothetical protein
VAEIGHPSGAPFPQLKSTQASGEDEVFPPPWLDRGADSWSYVPASAPSDITLHRKHFPRRRTAKIVAPLKNQLPLAWR